MSDLFDEMYRGNPPWVFGRDSRWLAEANREFTGVTPALVGFFSPQRWHELFFRVEQVAVAVLLPTCDTDIDWSDPRYLLPAIKLRPHGPNLHPLMAVDAGVENSNAGSSSDSGQEFKLFSTDVGKAVVRVDQHPRVFRLVTRDNTLVTYLQWAHTALALWYLIDNGIPRLGTHSASGNTFPRGFLVSATPDGLGAARIEMSFGSSVEHALIRTSLQLPVVDVVAGASYDQSRALTAIPAFRVVSQEPWYMASRPFGESDSPFGQRHLSADRDRACVHYIPAALAAKFTGQNRTSILQSLFEGLELPENQVARDVRQVVRVDNDGHSAWPIEHDISTALNSLLYVCKSYDSRTIEDLLPEPEPDHDDEYRLYGWDASHRIRESNTRSQKAAKKQREKLEKFKGSLRAIQAEVVIWLEHMSHLARHELGTVDKLELLTAVLLTEVPDRTPREAERETEPPARKGAGAPEAWEGIITWCSAKPVASSHKTTLLEVLFVMTVHREHLESLFGFKPERFNRQVDHFVKTFGVPTPPDVRKYAAEHGSDKDSYWQFLY